MSSDIVERLRADYRQGDRHLAADEIERLRERCEAYKGQVEAGSAEITRLRASRDEVVEECAKVAEASSVMLACPERPEFAAHIRTAEKAREIIASNIRRLSSPLQGGE
jgi:chromosome segregation ATPase